MSQTLASSIARVLIAAGSDSGGGAGIQADLKTLAVLGAYGMTAVTALTAQNTTGVHATVALPADFVARQIEVCVEDIGCDAIKTGMLANRGIVLAVAAQLRTLRGVPIVVDPVLLASSGAELLERHALKALKEQLLPLATVVTPNLAEAAALTGQRVGKVAEMKEAARRIADLGPRNVVVTGGHLQGDALDVLFDGTSVTQLRGPRLGARAAHGTGCVFSTALAVCLARGQSFAESAARAKELVTTALRGGLTLGKGNGPVNPLAWLERRSQGMGR